MIGPFALLVIALFTLAFLLAEHFERQTPERLMRRALSAWLRAAEAGAAQIAAEPLNRAALSPEAREKIEAAVRKAEQAAARIDPFKMEAI